MVVVFCSLTKLNDWHADFQEAFGLFDKDGDGYLSAQEAGVVVRSLGAVVTEAELSEMVSRFDHSKMQIDS